MSSARAVVMVGKPSYIEAGVCMDEEISRAEIDLARIPADSNVGGLIFAVATVLIFVIGIPAIRSIFPAIIAAGCGVALVLRLTHR
jgi:hypothetical protein